MNVVPLPGRRSRPRRGRRAPRSRAHDVHADAAAGDLRDLRRGRESRLEQAFDRAAARSARASAAIRPSDRARSRTLREVDAARRRRRARSRTSLPTWRTVSVISPVSGLPGGARASRDLDAVVERVAQQVLERTDELFEHRAVELGLRRRGSRGSRACRAPSRSCAGSGRGARTGCRTARCGSRTAAAARRATGAPARAARRRRRRDSCSSACCTVDTSLTPSASERVSSWKRVKRSNSSGSKSLVHRLRCRHPRLDLRLGLDLDLAHLAAQADHAVGELEQVRLERAQLAFDARARDRHFAGLVDQPVDDVGAHAQHRCAPTSASTVSVVATAHASPRARRGGDGMLRRSPATPLPRSASASAALAAHRRRCAALERTAAERWSRRSRSASSTKATWSRSVSSASNSSGVAGASVSPSISRDSIRCVSSPRRIAPAIRALPLNVCSVRRSCCATCVVARAAAPAAHLLARLRDRARPLPRGRSASTCSSTSSRMSRSGSSTTASLTSSTGAAATEASIEALSATAGRSTMSGGVDRLRFGLIGRLGDCDGFQRNGIGLERQLEVREDLVLGDDRAGVGDRGRLRLGRRLDDRRLLGRRLLDRRLVRRRRLGRRLDFGLLDRERRGGRFRQRQGCLHGRRRRLGRRLRETRARLGFELQRLFAQRRLGGGGLGVDRARADRVASQRLELARRRDRLGEIGIGERSPRAHAVRRSARARRPRAPARAARSTAAARRAARARSAHAPAPAPSAAIGGNPPCDGCRTACGSRAPSRPTAA